MLYTIYSSTLNKRYTMNERECLSRMVSPSMKRLKYNKLTIVEFIPSGYKDKNRQFVRCICECRREKITTIGALERGSPRSCRVKECWHSYKHGGHNTITYQSWRAMRKRCLDTNDKDYPRYGGRGIKIDPRWDDFAVFLADVGERPSSEYQLDRFPNNNGNYEPENVRWATVKEQALNRRSNTIIEFNGQSLTMSEWADKLGIGRSTLCERLTAGWSVEAALTESVKGVRI